MSAQTFYTSTFNIQLLILIVIHLLVTDTESSNQYSSSKAVWVKKQKKRHPVQVVVSSGASVSQIMQTALDTVRVAEMDAKSKDNIIPVSRTVETLLEEDIGTSAECPLLLIEPEGMELIFSMQCLTVILGLRSVSPIIQENALIDLEVRAHYYNYS